ncbi:MAG: iron ABC transporter permease [Candidatus Omnitrophota bacterium]
MKEALTRHSYYWLLLLYFLPLAAALAAAPLVGAERIDALGAIKSLFGGGAANIDFSILFSQRIPRVLLAALAGGTLAAVGACFQAILHNPLAEPYTLGVTGGSTMGATLAIVVPGLHFSWGPFSTVQLFSLLGAAAALIFLYALSRRPEGIAAPTLLLAGITVSIVSAGFILFMRYAASPEFLIQMDRWLMGGLEIGGFEELTALFPFLLPGLYMLFSCRLEMNHLSVGEELAAGHGVDVGSVQKKIFFGGGLTTAAVVSLSGPIGFVGLIVPHAVRRLSGYDHRIALPGCFFLGGAFLVACDAAARTLFSPREMPVGIITALIGGPVFIWILLKKR